MRASLLAAASLAGLLAAPHVLAQDEAERQPDEPTITVEEEVLVEADAPYFPATASTASKSSRPLEDLPLGVSVVSHAMLRDQNNLVLGDALHNVPGMNAQSNAGVHDYFFLRGFDSLSSSLVMSDGAPELEAPFYQLYNVDRVEVIRGPAGFLYGANPLAGAVNLVPKRPVDDHFVHLGLSLGSHDTTYDTVDGNWTWNDGRAGLRLNGLYARSDGWRRNKESEVVGVSPILSFGVGAATVVTVAAEALSSDFTPDSGIPFFVGEGVLPEVPLETAYETPDDFSNQDLGRLRVDVEHRLSDRAELRNKTYWSALDWRTDGTILLGAFRIGPGPLDGIVPRLRNRLDDRQDLLGNQTELATTFTTGGIEHQLVAGLELSRYRDEFTLDVAFLDPAPVSAVVLDGGAEIPLPQAGLRADAESQVVAPYVLDTIGLTSRLDLYLGARYDIVDFEDPFAGSAPGTAQGIEREDEHLSPFVGLAFAARDGLTLYGNYAESFAPPSTTVAGDGRAPEEGRQVEIGAKARFGDRLRAALSVYDLVKDNIAIPDSSGFFRTQLGEQSARGVELEVAGEAPAELRWLFTYAYTDAELEQFRETVQIDQPPFLLVRDHSGNVPAFTPEHLASLWVSRSFDSGLGVAVGGRYLDEQAIAPDNTYFVDAYATLDAAVSYRFSRFTAWLDLDNLTDEETFGRGFGAASVLPLDGFHWTAGLRLEL